MSDSTVNLVFGFLAAAFVIFFYFVLIVCFLILMGPIYIFAQLRNDIDRKRREAREKKLQRQFKRPPGRQHPLPETNST